MGSFGRKEQLAILEADLQNARQVVDITSRPLFESRVFEGRQQRELTPEELCEAMTEAQRKTYGDGLDPNALHRICGRPNGGILKVVSILLQFLHSGRSSEVMPIYAPRI